MKDKEFDKYIDHCLENGDFDEDGSSASAVVKRLSHEGIFAALKFEVKEFYRDVKFFLTDFEGLETPIGWFAQLLILPLLIPVFPFIRIYFRYKRAISAFKESYERDLKSGKYPPEKHDEK